MPITLLEQTAASVPTPTTNKLTLFVESVDGLVKTKDDAGTVATLGAIANGDKGDITTSGGGATWTIDNDAVTYAKMQNVSAAERLLGRGAGGGAGDVQEVTLGSGLSFAGTVLSASGSGAPFDDGTAIIKGSADATKLFRIEVDGFTTATTRVATPPNADFTMAGINIAQTFTAAQTLSLEDAGTNTVLFPAKATRTSSGTPANGIGVGWQFEVETTAGNNEIGATLSAEVTDVTSTSEDFALVAKTMVAGSTTLVEGGRWVGAQYLAPNGSSSAPSLSFASGTGYGFYLESGVLVGAIAGGTVNLYFGSSSMQVRLPMNFNSGSAANSRIFGNTQYVIASTAGVGAPLALAIDGSSICYTNEGTTAKSYFTLPAATSYLVYDFIVQDADGIRIVAGAGDTIRVIDKVTAAAGYIESTTIGSTVRLIAINATEWIAFQIHGEWTDGTFTYSDVSLTTP